MANARPNPREAPVTNQTLLMCSSKLTVAASTAPSSTIRQQWHPVSHPAHGIISDMNDPRVPVPDLRERTRRAVRAELMAEAWRLFATQGFEATTVEQIAAAAGMSKRSFFRYFASKEDLVLGNLEDVGREVAAALAERPADESAWQALRRAFDGLVAGIEADPDRFRPLLTMLRSEPGLHASHVEKRQRWQAMLAPLLARRVPARAGSFEDRPDPRLTALAGAALTCFDAAQTAWLDDPAPDLAALLDEAMSAISALAP
jgi:AcrR family transcriptional regulator